MIDDATELKHKMVATIISYIKLAIILISLPTVKNNKFFTY